MSFFGWGPNSIESTARGLQTTLSTTTLLAEVDLNGTNAGIRAGGQAWGVAWILGGGATGTVFLCDHALSTGTGATGIINQTVVPVSSMSVAQIYTKHRVESSQAGLQGHRFRVRLASSVVSASAKVIAEPLV